MDVRPDREPLHRLVICNWRDSAHPLSGGAELYCEEVARRLRGDGYDVTFLTARSAGSPRAESTSYGRVIRMGGTFSTYLRVLLWLLRHRREVDGIIDSANGIPYFVPLAVSRRTPVALLLHHVHQDQFGLYWPAPAALVGRLLEKWMSRWVYGHRPVAVVSPSVRAEVRRRLAFKGPVTIAPNGADPHPDTLPVKSLRPKIVCVGRLVPHKRMQLLMEAVPPLRERWPDLEVHVIGDGPDRARLQANSIELGVTDTVTFHGRLPTDERDAALGSAWLTVNPSVGEGWGLSVIEAAGLGVPAVAFEVPGLRDSVRPGVTGWLVEEGGDLVATIDQALRTMADADQASEFIERGREWAASFSWEATAQRLTAVLQCEADRLARGIEERRTHSDAATVLIVPAKIATRDVIDRLRRYDQVRRLGDDVQLLLEGADERDALIALRRIGLPDGVARDVRVARHRDLLGWRPRPVADELRPIGAGPSIDVPSAAGA